MLRWPTGPESEILRNVSQALQAVVTALSLVIAGFWTYLLFIRRRQKFPRAQIEQNIFEHRFADGDIWLHVTVTIKNVGDVLIRLTSASVRLDRVVPLASEIISARNAAQALRQPNESEIRWQRVDRNACEWPKAHYEIEPGEADQFHFDFMVPAALNLEIVEVYAHFRNTRKRFKHIGWNCTTIHTLGKLSEIVMTQQDEVNAMPIDESERLKKQGPEKAPLNPTVIRPTPLPQPPPLPPPLPPQGPEKP